jgi:hypothetical protein
MDNENSMTENTQSHALESAKKPEILTETYSAMKAEIKDEAQQLLAGHQGNVSKRTTLTETCSTMKAEIKAEAKRLVPDLGDRH